MDKKNFPDDLLFSSSMFRFSFLMTPNSIFQARSQMGFIFTCGIITCFLEALTAFPWLSLEGKGVEVIQMLMEDIQKTRETSDGLESGHMGCTSSSNSRSEHQVPSGMGVWSSRDLWRGNRQPTTLGNKLLVAHSS